MARKILVICALGYATSSMIKRNIEESLLENDIKNWKVDSVGLRTSENQTTDAAMIVHSVSLKQCDYSVPLFDGIPLISGINKESTIKQIIEQVRKYDSENE